MSIAESLSFYLSSGTNTSTSVVRPVEFISNTTPSVSTTTGALVVSGGVGIAGTLTLGGGLTLGGINYTSANFTPQGYQVVATGVTTTYPLSFTPPSLTSLIVTIDGLVEYDYTINGNSLTFGFTPDSGSIIRVFCFGVTGPTGTVTPGSVTSSSFAPGAIVGGLGFTPISGTATAAQYYSASTNLALTPAVVWAAAAPVTVNDASPITLDLNSGINFSVTLTSGVGATRQLANPINAKPGQTGWIRVTQSATGNNAITFGTNWHFSTGTITTVSNTVNVSDIIYYTAISSTYLQTSIAKYWI